MEKCLRAKVTLCAYLTHTRKKKFMEQTTSYDIV